MTTGNCLRLRRNLKALRKITGTTQSDLAAKIGLCRSTYGQIERGLREPDLNILQAICQTFHITLDVLVGYDIPFLLGNHLLYGKPLPDDLRLIHIYSQLTLRSKKRLMERAESLYRRDAKRKRLSQ
ncbi:MAG: helix-turn-helix transcriptional regulator [Firmicutes bacterium]|nr:helix-turn-helix transcriptional regulator [Bacillota bacterium]